MLCGCGAKPEETVQTSEQTVSESGVDVDLAAMSSTMVYAEVYNMTYSPGDYIGKTIKLRGQYYASYYEQTGKYYHYIVVSDATACCQQGVEFLFSTEHAYPDDYPADGTEVEAVGVYGSYEELGQVYYYLLTDELTVK